MQMRGIVFVLTFALACGLAATGQQTPPPERQEREIAARVAALTARLDYRDNDPADQDRYYDEMDDVTGRIRDELDRYIQEVVDPRETSEQIQARMRKLLPRMLNPLYGDGPFAQVAELPIGRSLLLAYTIVRPPHHDWSTVRGYLQAANRFELVAATGHDFDGFNMFKRELRSPLSGELWLMAWGQAHTANGKIVRFRVYAFDGQTFRTVWSPKEMVNANVTFSDAGFAINHYRRPDSVHEEYLLTPGGVVKVQ